MDLSDLDSALKTITEIDSKTLEVERVSIWFFNQDRSEIVCEDLYLLSKNIHEKGLRLQAKDYPGYFQALEEGRFIAAHDARTHPGTSAFTEGYLKPSGITSMMDAPIRFNGKLVGLVCHEHTGPRREWTLEEQDFVASVANHVSLILAASERRRAEEDLRKSEARLAEAQRMAQIGSWELGLVSNTLIWSDEVYRMFGLEPQEFRATYEAFLDNIHPDDREMVNKAYTESVENKTPYNIIHRLLLKDGTIKYVNERCETFYDDDGKPIRSIGTVQDITEARLMERRLLQSEKLASLGFLVSGIAHEINNPNSFITFNIPIMRDYLHELIPIIDDYAKAHPDFELFGMSYPEFRKDIFKLLDNIEHGSKRINATVSALREYSRRKDKKELRWVDIRQVIGKGVDICRDKIRSMVKSFEVKVPKDLSQVYTDPETVEHVLINLLINAAQAADKEDSWVRLNVAPGRSWREHLIFEVSDNGCGMDEATLKKIFDPFFTTKAHGEGTGLGLNICHTLIEALGGRIEVESAPAKGSIFRVILTHKDRRGVKRL